MQPLVLAHISDLHVSTFGDSLHDRARVVKRSARPLDLEATLPPVRPKGEASKAHAAEGDGAREPGRREAGPPPGRPGAGARRFLPLWEAEGWQVLEDRGGRKPVLVLVDPEGYIHPIPRRLPARADGNGRGLRSAPEAAAADDPDDSTELAAPPQPETVQRAAARAALLNARRARVLAARPPGPEAVARLLAETPQNTNLRLLRAAQAVEGSDVVLITGDLTDDGYGYELIEAAFEPWLRAGRLLAIPGNHDLYLFPISSSGRPRPTHESKRRAWQAFAARLGLELDETGAWVRTFPYAETVIVGLDSCAGRQPRFYRHNGAIGKAQLAWLRRVAEGPDWRAARHRIVALHHHVVPLPHGVGRRAPSEIGMRLDDAKAVAAVLNEIGATYVMHGHRHISEARHPAGCHFRLLAAPSLTLGCKSGDRPSYWRVELDLRADAQRVYVPVEAVAQENDPAPAA